MVEVKTASEIERMRAAGAVVGETLRLVAAAARPGVRLDELDALAADHIRASGAKPSFQGYLPDWAPIPYPGVVCLSVNSVIVHGLPNRTRLRDGDLLSIDCGAVLDGYHGDAAVTVAVGSVDAAGTLLMQAASSALEAGIAQARVGARIGDISHAIQTVIRSAGYGTPSGWGGHGIGTEMHQDPPVPNTGRAGRGLRLVEGMVLAIEPMVCEGGRDQTRVLPDGWSIGTCDGTRAAHAEHTVAITADGPVVLTL